ncbi:MAG: class I SAM-dependent methyltransferase [Candidatus Schekmanbacteria bacterium]|nr:class I SAM-dependent methyltransferase [Candidatus Schekmanbacteria bacterium]
MNKPEPSKEFAGKLLNIYSGAVLTKLIDIGYQTGLFEAASEGPATSSELSKRAGLNERYVREWLCAMATGGIFTYDPSSEKYSLPEEHALYLTGNKSINMSPLSRMINHFGSQLTGLTKCFRNGGGIPYQEFRPEFTNCMDDTWRRIFDEHLIGGFIGRVDGLSDRLKAGINVLDIGCGTGHAMNILASEFPASKFYGYDIAEDAVARARNEAKIMGLLNSKFEVIDVSEFSQERKFDLITAFDTIHDQQKPLNVLQQVKKTLSPDGTFLMIEFKFSSKVENNMGNPFAPMYYGMSLMHCVTVSLACGGPGLGAVWGEESARAMLSDAGFKNVEMIDTPRPQNSIFVCRH